LKARIDRLWKFVWIFLFGIVLAACRSVSPTGQPVVTVSITSTATQPATPSVTPAQTPTQTQPTPLAVLLAPGGSDSAIAESLYASLKEPIAQAGWRWEMQTELVPQDPGLKLVIALPPDPGIAELASQAPQVQFVTLGMEDIPPMANLSHIQGETRFDQQGFLAGAIAAMITPDWRVGVVSTSDTAEGKAARNGFLNGAVYFCGLCLAYHGPIFDYPLYVDIPSNAGQSDWQAAVDALVSQAVKTVYVFPGIDQAELMNALAQAGINIIGSGTPPEDIKAQWVASITTDPAEPIQEHLTEFLAGEGGIDMTAPLVIQEVNPALFSPGRQDLADKIRIDLLGRKIGTGVEPQTGETP
jgi:hypothetical protein